VVQAIQSNENRAMIGPGTPSVVARGAQQSGIVLHSFEGFMRRRDFVRLGFVSMKDANTFSPASGTEWHSDKNKIAADSN